MLRAAEQEPKGDVKSLMWGHQAMAIEREVTENFRKQQAEAESFRLRRQKTRKGKVEIIDVRGKD